MSEEIAAINQSRTKILIGGSVAAIGRRHHWLFDLFYRLLVRKELQVDFYLVKVVTLRFQTGPSLMMSPYVNCNLRRHSPPFD